MSFYQLRSAVVSIQNAYRRKVAVLELKRLRAEAKDLNKIAQERDKFREETRRLREELERAKLDGEKKGRMTKEAEVKELKQEVKKLKAELEKARHLPVSPTLSHAKELGYLAQECELKELQLKGLRRDLRAQYGASPGSSKDGIGHTFSDDTSTQEKKENREPRVPKVKVDQAQALRSPGRSSHTSQSLLDEDNPNEGYMDRSFQDAMSTPQSDANSKKSQYTSTTLSLSYSANTPGLRGEDFFSGLRSLHDAVRNGELEIVEEILVRSSEEPQVLINEGDEMGRTALHTAVLTSNLLMTKTLLEKAAISNAQDNDGETPLHLAETASMTGLLLKQGRANPNIPNIDGICALHLAVQRRDLDSVRALLLHNADVNSADNVRWFTPLHLISLQPRPGIHEDALVRARIAELMAGGASSRYEPDLNYQDSEGNCPLHYAVQLVTVDAYDIVKVSLDTGADPNVLNNRKQTPLHLICHNNSLRKYDFYPQLLNMVLRHGGDPNQQSAAGCTALHLSLYHRDIDSAVELVASGAQLHLVWKKPKRWVSFWDDHGSSSVMALDMVKKDHHLSRILGAISVPQKWAPSRTWCMQCKNTLGTFARALHCGHCGRFVCGDCSPRTLSRDHFPRNFEIEQPTWVCFLCEKILLKRKALGCTTPNRNRLPDDTSVHPPSSIHEFDRNSSLAEF